jgi:hypothetical protein
MGLEVFRPTADDFRLESFSKSRANAYAVISWCEKLYLQEKHGRLLSITANYNINNLLTTQRMDIGILRSYPGEYEFP